MQHQHKILCIFFSSIPHIGVEKINYMSFDYQDKERAIPSGSSSSNFLTVMMNRKQTTDSSLCLSLCTIDGQRLSFGDKGNANLKKNRFVNSTTEVVYLKIISLGCI